MGLVCSRTVWFTATMIVVAPILLLAHVSAGHEVLSSVLLSLLVAAGMGGLNAALLAPRTAGTFRRPQLPRRK